MKSYGGIGTYVRLGLRAPLTDGWCCLRLCKEVPAPSGKQWSGQAGAEKWKGVHIPYGVMQIQW